MLMPLTFYSASYICEFIGYRPLALYKTAMLKEALSPTRQALGQTPAALNQEFSVFVRFQSKFLLVFVIPIHYCFTFWPHVIP